MHCGAHDLGQFVPPMPRIVSVDAAHAFLARQVRLLAGSPFYARQELHRKGLLAFYDPNKLLYSYRALAQLPQQAGIESGYDGWDVDSFAGTLPGPIRPPTPVGRRQPGASFLATASITSWKSSPNVGGA